MNQLTAIRSFAKPSFCPVKKTRIQNNKWYLVEMQDIETDARTDYVGLAETSTVYLWNGEKTRQERDSRLNHCNNIVEYTGNVFALVSTNHRITEYYPSIQSALIGQTKRNNYQSEMLSKALASIDKQQAMTDSEILKIYGNCKDWPGNETKQITKFRKDLQITRERNIEYWKPNTVITQIK